MTTTAIRMSVPKLLLADPTFLPIRRLAGIGESRKPKKGEV